MKKNNFKDDLYMSFKTEPEVNGLLSSVDFQIEENHLSAFYRGDDLIFVLDKTINEAKPNVLLIIDPVDYRKWDDILTNDYNVNLELIRPKVDNKYRKLDIDYDGLSIYKHLIEDYKNGDDLTNSLNELSNFRNSSIKMAASQRLVSSQNKIRKSSITVDKTDKTLAKLQEDFKKLRLKLQKQRKKNEDPEKIEKTETRIQNLILKMRRSKKRLKRAEKRLEAAKKDSDISEEILKQKYTIKTTKAVDVMSDEEVKPLFEKDPEVMDEKIAFKPIDFDSDKFEDSEVVPNVSEIMTDSKKHEDDEDDEEEITYNNSFENSVIDSIKPVEVLPSFEPIETAKEIEEVKEEKAPEEARFVEPLQRPVSPRTGKIVGDGNVNNNLKDNTVLSSSQIVSNKPSPVYYLVLVLLIITSIFTLFLYQKRNCNNNVPNITADKIETVFVEEKAEEQNPEINNQDSIEPAVNNTVESEEHTIEPENNVEQMNSTELVDSVEEIKPEDSVEQGAAEESVAVEPEQELVNENTEKTEEHEEISSGDLNQNTDDLNKENSVGNSSIHDSSIRDSSISDSSDEEHVLVNKPEYNVSSDRDFSEDENFEYNNSIPPEEQVPDNSFLEQN